MVGTRAGPRICQQASVRLARRCPCTGGSAPWVDPLEDPGHRALQRVVQFPRRISFGAADPPEELLQLAPLAAGEVRHDALAPFPGGDGAPAGVRPVDDGVVVEERAIEEHPGEVRLRVRTDAETAPSLEVTPGGVHPAGDAARGDLPHAREAPAEAVDRPCS